MTAVITIVIVAALIGLGYAFRGFLHREEGVVIADLQAAVGKAKSEAIVWKVKVQSVVSRLEFAAKADEASVVAEAEKLVAELKALL